MRSFQPSSQLLFGTDYPLLPTQATIAGLANIGLDDDEYRAVSHDNASTLFPRAVTEDGT